VALRPDAGLPVQQTVADRGDDRAAARLQVKSSLSSATIWALLAAAAIAASAELGFSRSLTPGLIAYREKQFGAGTRARLEGWKSFVRETAAVEAMPRQAGEDRLLRPVNRFFNRIPS